MNAIIADAVDSLSQISTMAEPCSENPFLAGSAIESIENVVAAMKPRKMSCKRGSVLQRSVERLWTLSRLAPTHIQQFCFDCF